MSSRPKNPKYISTLRKADFRHENSNDRKARCFCFDSKGLIFARKFKCFRYFQSYPQNQARTFAIDSETVYNGVYDPNNILIHVSQNFFNFATSTAAWLVTAALYESRDVNARHQRQKRYLLNEPDIDPATVYVGVQDPNNILIHVSQNFVNFASSTLAWFVLAFFYDNASVQKRRKRASSAKIDSEETAAKRFNGERIANVFRSFASTAESLDR